MDVRQSDLDYLQDKAKRLSYNQYLSSLKMSNVRSFENQTITFNFPVTAIIGTNGGGKSTILGSAALAYKTVKPGDFFPKSNIGDNSMSSWRIDYEIIDRSINSNQTISRNARFASAKWRRDGALNRNVVVVPIQRTVPASEQTRFKHFVGLTQQTDIISTPITPEVATIVSRILGKDASGYVRISLKSDQSKSILVGLKNKNDYSQFHFGAGEASIIEMVSRIEESSEFSLILIEEIENGLHPLATMKMIEYLIDVAKRKKSQIIFTTHSEYALGVLPPNAIWACIDGVAYQGKLNIDSLRALTGVVSTDAAIFVEDDFAKDLCEEIIRQHIPEILRRVEIHKAGGFPYVVDVLKHHNSNPMTTQRAVAVIDGDNPPLAQPNEFVLSLPEGAPERVVFNYISENLEQVSALIQQRCQCPSVSQDRIVEYVKSVSRDTTDHHLLFSKLGERFGFVSEIIIRRGLCSIYVERNFQEFQGLVSALKQKLLV